MCKAVSACHAVYPLRGGRPKLFGIMVGMYQRDSIHVHKTVMIPQVQFLDKLLRLLDEPVAIPQLQFLDDVVVSVAVQQVACPAVDADSCICLRLVHRQDRHVRTPPFPLPSNPPLSPLLPSLSFFLSLSFSLPPSTHTTTTTTTRVLSSSVRQLFPEVDTRSHVDSAMGAAINAAGIAVQMAVAEVSRHSCGKVSAAVSACGAPGGRLSAMVQPKFSSVPEPVFVSGLLEPSSGSVGPSKHFHVAAPSHVAGAAPLLGVLATVPVSAFSLVRSSQSSVVSRFVGLFLGLVTPRSSSTMLPATSASSCRTGRPRY